MKFRLLKAHYLRIKNREDFFEQKETPLGSNEAVTHRYRVDRYCDPDDPVMWNWDPITEKYRRPGSFRPALNEVGWLVVVFKAEGQPYELVATGGPTTEMEGIDTEAKAKIEELQALSVRPFDELPATGVL